MLYVYIDNILLTLKFYGMKLTKVQEEAVKNVWGDEANKILVLFSQKKGKCKIFNEDGSLAKTKEEVVAMLQKPSKKKVSIEDQAKQMVREDINKLKHELGFLEYNDLLDIRNYIEDLMTDALNDELNHAIEERDRQNKIIENLEEELRKRKVIEVNPNSSNDLRQLAEEVIKNS